MEYLNNFIYINDGILHPLQTHWGKNKDKIYSQLAFLYKTEKDSVRVWMWTAKKKLIEKDCA